MLFRWILFPPKQNGKDTKQVLKERKLLNEDLDGGCDSMPPLEWIITNYEANLQGLEYLFPIFIVSYLFSFPIPVTFPQGFTLVL